jgi:DNA-binding NtrC family response regulator
LSEDALKVLVNYDWPGNVRELEAVIERALLLSDGDQVLPADLPAAVRAGITPRPRGPAALDIPESGIDLEGVERSLIRRAMEKTSGNVSRAARLLGLSRRTLQYRLEKMQGAPEGAMPERNGAAEGES